MRSVKVTISVREALRGMNVCRRDNSVSFDLQKTRCLYIASEL